MSYLSEIEDWLNITEQEKTRILPQLINITDGQTHDHVHADHTHDDDEDGEDDLGEPDRILLQSVVDVQLPSHHCHDLENTVASSEVTGVCHQNVECNSK